MHEQADVALTPHLFLFECLRLYDGDRRVAKGFATMWDTQIFPYPGDLWWFLEVAAGKSKILAYEDWLNFLKLKHAKNRT